jgi:hypothetical protein
MGIWPSCARQCWHTATGGRSSVDFALSVAVAKYADHAPLGKPGRRFQLAYCWAHVRRKLVEAEDFAPEPCERVLDLIRELALGAWDRSCRTLLQPDRERETRGRGARRIFARRCDVSNSGRFHPAGLAVYFSATWPEQESLTFRAPWASYGQRGYRLRMLFSLGGSSSASCQAGSLGGALRSRSCWGLA